MGAISAGLLVEGHFFPIISCEYGAYQATDARGRVITKVRFTPVELVIDVPATDFLLVWAASPTQRYPVTIIWRDVNAGGAIETLAMTGARCSGYHEFFEAGDKTTGSYRCHLTLTDPTGWQLTPGGPAASAQARVMPPGFVPRLIAPPAAPPPVELPPAGPGPLGLLGRLLAVLPELALATLVAVFIPANDADSPGYQSEKDLFKRLHNIPLTDKDRAELADLEQRHANGTLSPDEEGHLLALLARVKGLHLASLPKKIPLGFPDTDTFKQAGDELKAALKESGLKYTKMGVRGSSVTGLSSKGGSFRPETQNGIGPSDIDVFVELADQADFPTSRRIPGLIYPEKLMKRYPALQEWSDKWGEKLGREITPGAFQPGTFSDENIILF